MPKVITTRRTVYQYSELGPKAKATAFADFQARRDESGDIPWGDETHESWKALYEAAGVRARDWKVGPYAYSHIRAEFPGDDDGHDVGALKGRRAYLAGECGPGGKDLTKGGR